MRLTAAPTSAPSPSSLCSGHTCRIWTNNKTVTLVIAMMMMMVVVVVMMMMMMMVVTIMGTC